ncbi:magnesium transporter CorA family protein [Sphingomicrobium nitratireducens]|uniref:magnesium transporter CorA family protein n=1 Tax=Sphingomicrobium nitratireducens TaxID=2964666 RepID=UPI0022401082|nr:magnesium transporter CorA family protein [Sphingomicrobium nitratireducens]
MLRCFLIDGEPASDTGCDEEALARAQWIDCLDATDEERARVAAAVGRSLPSLEDLAEIEPSSRLYEEDGTLFLTLSVLFGVDARQPQSGPVGFLLSGDRLVTIRAVDPKPFATFLNRLHAEPEAYAGPAGVMVGLIDAMVDRLADQLETASEEIEAVSRRIFEHDSDARSPELKLEALILRIGRVQQLLSKVRETSISTGRLLSFFGARRRIREDGELAEEVRALAGDLKALDEHTNFLSDNITFLLDAALGLIGVQQNVVMKIFSVVAVVLMPPTLVAGIYGMNFRHMPELDWPWGYPLAIGLMLASAILPYRYARSRGWL